MIAPPMSEGERAWLEVHAIAWAAKAEQLLGGAVTPSERVRADCLARVAAGLRQRLDDAPPRAPPAPEPEADAPATWLHPAFWREGVFNPAAGTRALRMMASAAVCRAKGELAAAAAFERHAVAAGDDAGEEHASAPRWGARADFSLPVPEVVPFVAGPQMDMFA